MNPDRPTLTRTGKNLLINIPMRLRRRSTRKEVVATHTLDDTLPLKATEPGKLAIAIARGHVWQEYLDQGRFASATDLADALGVNRSYASRIIRLTLLAPDLLEAILRGREPEGLTLARAVEEIPVIWSEQRERFGAIAAVDSTP